MEINQPGDPLEQEADRMADQVMRMKAPAVQRKYSSSAEEEKVQRKCAGCEEEEKNSRLQRKEAGAGPQFAPASVHSVLNAPGQALDPATRAFMEPRFGRDFSHVCLHTDANAAGSARDVNALAYASGKHVVFASNQYSPGTPEGRRLLAHELTHVLQQSETVRRVCDPVALGARTAPAFFPKQAKVMDVFTGGSTLKKGSTDKEAVGLVQQALTDLCFDEGIWGPNKDGVDRKFGDDTENGVKAFQGSQTITDSGEVNKETLRCLDETRSKRIEPCKSAPMQEADLLIKEQRTGGADEDIFFGRGDKTLDAEDKTKLGKIAKNQKDTPITLSGFESEDELVDFGDKLAGERVDAVSTELGTAGQGDEAKYRKKDPQPQASAGKLDYRRSRRVHIVVPGTPAPPDCTKNPPGWTHPDFGPCDVATEKIVQDAIDRGVKFMDDAIKALKPGDATAEKAVADRFGDKKHLAEVKTRLGTWKTHLDTFVRSHHECTNECHSACVGTGAYTSNKDTFLCPKVMQKPANKDDENEQALIILHEAGHGALSTKDVAYDATRMLSLIQKDYSLAKINTDSYVLLIQCLNGITIRGMGCTVPKPGDKFTGTNAGEQTIAEEALAWLERWMDFVWQDVNNLYPAVVRARMAGKWSADDSAEQSTMDLLSKHFGLHRPEGSPAPTMREETEVAAIHERYFRMNRFTEKRVAREFVKDDAATPEWKDSPAKVVVNNAFFSKAPRARVRFLVELLVKAQPDISSAAEPAYVAFADADAKTWFDKP
jgi:peptidoglycan hydrolase-like protein with peptidoglycan-binding domain